MFLMDVISSESIVRTVSALIEDRERRVVEGRRAVDDHEVVLGARSASSMRLAPAGVMSSAISGDGGREQDVDARRVA